MMTGSIWKLKKAADFYLCQNRNLSYLTWLFFYASKLRFFKDLHQGEDCFIMGNGPSLNKIDLSRLNHFHVFGLNKIYLLLDKIELNLSYHVAVNPFVIQQSKEALESLSCPTFLSYCAAKNVIDSKSHVYFIATSSGISFHKDIINILSEGWTVTYVALQLAYYMGFHRVFLIGVDHNFSTQGDPNETQILQGDDPNHFDPNYFKDQQWQLPDLDGSELSYHLARFSYERSGRKIFDATVGGKLTIFDKIEFEQALTLCHPKST